MIEALFNQPNFLTATKALDAVVMREGAVANNLANLETPGYKRIDLAPSFETELERASASGDAQQISAVQPSLAVDASATPSSMDGNTVHLESELMQMNQNSMTHALETQLISGMLSRMQMAITGKD
jgi:flagellar basal-body rod protein FlgB